MNKFPQDLQVVWDNAAHTLTLQTVDETFSGNVAIDEVPLDDILFEANIPVVIPEEYVSLGNLQVKVYAHGELSNPYTITVEQDIQFEGDLVLLYPSAAGHITVNGERKNFSSTTEYNLTNFSKYVYGSNDVVVKTLTKEVPALVHRRPKTLLNIEVLADYFQYHLNQMGLDTSSNYEYKTPYTVETITNIGVSKLREKSISIKEPQHIAASLNLVQGTVGDNAELDTYSYDLQYFFIATAETAKALKERIDTFTYNNQGKTIPVAPENYSGVGRYSLATIGQPFIENGEERVAVVWFIAVDFIREGVYAEDIKWEMSIDGGETFLPMIVLDSSVATTFGTAVVHNSGTSNVKTDLVNRSMAWHFTLPYTRSTLTSYIVENYILSGEDNIIPFTAPLTIKYAEQNYIQTFKINIVNAKFNVEAGKIIGLDFDCTEAM